jgi:hypothetical protein
MISTDLQELLESGISILVGTRSDRLVPECCRGVGARVEDGGAELTVFLPVATSEGTIANLRDNGRIAVCFARAMDHRSVQVKGSVLGIEEARAEDRPRVLEYRMALAEAWGVIGVPPRITLRMVHWPCHAVRLRVGAIFNQTPGPGAGGALGPRGDR